MKLGDVKMLKFGTKAENLIQLAGRLQSAVVLPQLIITYSEWRDDNNRILSDILSRGWYERPLAIRSSAKDEDTMHSSLAGKYRTELNIIGEHHIREAVESVFESYGAYHNTNQILVQPMIENAVLSGVTFSTDPNNGGNYIVVNYDDSSGSTTTVTSGSSNHLRTFYYFKGSDRKVENPMCMVIELVQELEALFQHNKLDIEFAIDENGVLYLLQVRPLMIGYDVPSLEGQTSLLNRVFNKFKKSQGRKPYLYGKRSFYGLMPDWNPAEIVGVRPRPLALSLYKELVTDSIWAYQRDNYGYKNLRSFPLLINFAGFPYIDIRVSFNSFLPKNLSSSICEKLIDYYTDRLIENPHHHDKVEFEIIISCYTFDLPDKMNNLLKHGFSMEEIDEIKSELKSLTSDIIDPENGLLAKDLKRIEELEHRRQHILESDLDIVSKIYWLLEDCKRYGTLPFAGLARGGFIAVQLLRSLIGQGILTETDYQSFMSELDTVGSKINIDFHALDKDQFIQQYGHLRPGTYDILSPRYDEDPGKYFDFARQSKDVLKRDSTPFLLSISQFSRINEMLIEHGLDVDVLKLFHFIKRAIEGREYSKFVFTKSLSAAITLYDELAQEYGITTEEASYADIGVVKQAYETEKDVLSLLMAAIKDGKERYRETLQVNLPPLIMEPDDVWFYYQLKHDPNFITLKTVTGKVAVFNGESEGLSGSILLIPCADPGYEWIFTKGILGFITMYGGANSHMAIRAGELSIPAVIGVGEDRFNEYKRAEVIEIDCANKQVRVFG